MRESASMSKGHHGQRSKEHFKKMIVKLVESNRKSVSENHREYGMSKVTIYQWMIIYGEESVQEKPMTNEKALKLKLEIIKLKEENQILKKLWPYSRKNNPL